MRYLISKNKYKSKLSRQAYIYDVFGLYSLEKNNNSNFIILDSIPTNHIDVMFIVGHDIEVYQYLKKNIDNIKEQNIVLITCNSQIFREFVTKDRNIFVPKCDSKIVKYYDGKRYGFNFEITDTELDIFNCRIKDSILKIKKCMVKLKVQ